MKGTEATAALAAHFREVTWAPARIEAIERFANELYEPAIPLLGEALKDNDGRVRAAAQSAFQAFKTQREAQAEFEAWQASSKEARATVEDLVKLLESSNHDVVVGAVQALGAIHARAALPAIVKLLDRKDLSDHDRQDIFALIQRFGGEAPPPK